MATNMGTTTVNKKSGFNQNLGRRVAGFAVVLLVALLAVAPDTALAEAPTGCVGLVIIGTSCKRPAF